MEELWNLKDIPLPCQDTYSIKSQDIDLNVKLKSIIQKLIEDFERNQEKFHLDSAFISRFLFMSFKQFRMMKGHQEMKKVDQALSKYLNFNIVSTLELFLGHFSDTSDSLDIRVPYREYLEYVLLKLQGTSKLLLRILDCSLKSMRYQFALVRAGSFVLKGGIFIATLSRIWDVCRGLCEEIVKSYNELFKYKESLRYKSKKRWIPQDYEFPDDLEEWLGLDFERLVKNVAENEQVLETLKDFVKSDLPERDLGDSVKVNEDFGKKVSGSSLESIRLKSSSAALNTKDFGEPVKRNLLKFEGKYEDFGEPISRNSLKFQTIAKSEAVSRKSLEASPVKAFGTLKCQDLRSVESRNLLKSDSGELINNSSFEIVKKFEENSESSEDFEMKVSQNSLKPEKFMSKLEKPSISDKNLKKSAKNSKKSKEFSQKSSEKLQLSLKKGLKLKRSLEKSEEIESKLGIPTKLLREFEESGDTSRSKSKKSLLKLRKQSKSANFCEESVNGSSSNPKKLKIPQSTKIIDLFKKSFKNPSSKLPESQESLKSTKEDTTHSLDSLKNTKSINKFIKQESNYRKLNDSKSITIKKLKNKEWKEFKDDLKRKSLLMKENLLINYIKNCLSDD